MKSNIPQIFKVLDTGIQSKFIAQTSNLLVWMDLLRTYILNKIQMMKLDEKRATELNKRRI